jgi:hypothetical protein
VGFIIFAILMIINFIVVTKGAGRVSEVNARFTLDAMPGKQMAIDADLNAGVIDQETAKKRREELAQESDFFGSMDGASKFVSGDAIAGLLILVINLVGGLIIGVIQHDMPLGEAGRVYSLLTIGVGPGFTIYSKNGLALEALVKYNFARSNSEINVQDINRISKTWTNAVDFSVGIQYYFGGFKSALK